LGFTAVTLTEASLAWGSNSNPSNVIYELSQSTLNFSLGSTVTVLTPFASNFTATVTTVTGLAPQYIYSYRVRAQNGDGTPTAYNDTLSFSILLSTGGSGYAGGPAVIADSGVIIVSALLANGTTQQIFVSTGTATVWYDNGISLQIPPGIQVVCVANAVGVSVTSTQTVPVFFGPFRMDGSSGTVTAQPNSGAFSISLAPTNLQDILVMIPALSTRTIDVVLNPPSGELRTLIPSLVMAQDVTLRFHLPDAYPEGTPFPALQSAPLYAEETMLGSTAFAPSSIITGTGIGIEITPDKPLQPIKPVNIQMGYRSSDLAGKKDETLAVCRFEDSVNRWLPLATSVRASKRTALGTTSHFSRFQLMRVLAADTANQPKIYPNPLQLYQGDTEMVFANLSANATVSLFTIAGELVRKLDAGWTGIARWDARNSSGETVASGVYLALIEGAQSSRKVMKVGVEK
jgi:hypothetical protein